MEGGAKLQAEDGLGLVSGERGKVMGLGFNLIFLELFHIITRTIALVLNVLICKL